MTRVPQNAGERAIDHLIAGVTNVSVGDLTSKLKTSDGRDLAAVLLGQRGGLRGGPARAEKLTPEQRTDIAKRAAAVRWGSKRDAG